MSKYCPSCGEELVDNAKFCKNCGMNLENMEANRNTAPSNAEQFRATVPQNDHKLAVYAGYVLAILIPLFGIIIAIYLMTRNDSDYANKHGKYVLILGVVIWFISFLISFH